MEPAEVRRKIYDCLDHLDPRTLHDHASDPYIHVTHILIGGARSTSFSFFKLVTPGDSIHNHYTPLRLLEKVLEITAGAVKNLFNFKFRSSSSGWAYVVIEPPPPTQGEAIIVVVIANEEDARCICSALKDPFR